MKASVTAAKKVAKASTVRLKSRSRSRGPAGAKGKKGRKSSSEEEEDEGDESDDEEEEERPSHPKVAKHLAAAKAKRRDDSSAEVEATHGQGLALLVKVQNLDCYFQHSRKLSMAFSVWYLQQLGPAPS